MEATELQDVLAGARDLVTVKRVYGDPYEKNGLTVIPAATVRGGAGGGGGHHGDDEAGTGGGIGMMARPCGAWVVEDGQATWKPAVDVNRIVLGGQVVALAAVLAFGRVLATRSRAKQPRAGLRRLCA